MGEPADGVRPNRSDDTRVRSTRPAQLAVHALVLRRGKARVRASSSSSSSSPSSSFFVHPYLRPSLLFALSLSLSLSNKESWTINTRSAPSGKGPRSPSRSFQPSADKHDADAHPLSRCRPPIRISLLSQPLVHSFRPFPAGRRPVRSRFMACECEARIAGVDAWIRRVHQ